MVDTKYLIDLVEQQKPNLKFPFPYTAETWVKDRELAVENYHKHTTWSNLSQTDSATSLEEFAAKGVERSCQCLFSGEHGYQGEWMYVYDCCKNPSFLKKIGAETPPRFRYSVEAYWVKDRHASDATNCHMVLVARTYEAMRKLNYIISMASENGYYYKPRIDLELLFTLSPDDVYITSACLAGWKYEDADELWLRIWGHFGNSFFLEYQAHDTDRQKELNAHIRDLANQYGIQTIVGLDTHYISEEDRLKRDNTLLRKGIRYDDEEGWYMDWPTGLVLLQRMQEQGVLSDGEIIRAMMNTHVFVDGCDDVVLNTEFKIPVLPQYQGKTYAERVDELKNILNRQYKKEPETHRTPERIAGLRYEMEQIDGSGTVDYFLMNYHIMQLATTPEYGGHLTTTSRGSAGSYYASKLLGFTTLDRFEAEVPMYPERFITKERILSSHQMPDIDSNCSEQGPFVAATRDLIGEFCCYPLLAVGKLKEKSAFKLYAGVNGVDPQLANDVTTSIDAYNEALKNVDEDDKEQIDIEDYIPDKELLSLYRQSLPYQNIIEQAKVHACAHIVFNGYDGGEDLIGAGDIRYEIGLIRCVSESTGNSEVVACVEGSLLDAYGYVKNDYLIVDVVGIIHKLYAAIGRTVPPVSELRQMVEGDAETWALYERGATCCLNQCENPGTTQKAKRYAPKSVKELAAFIAGIRPGFKSLLNGFLDRVEYTNGEPEIDSLLADCFHYMLYQEAVMKIFTWLGIPMKDSYDTIKKISKKKLVGEQLKAVEDTLKAHWLKHIGNLDNFDPVYQVVKDSSRYSFNACVSGDTVIQKMGNNRRYVPSVEEMYLIKNDAQYAKRTGHEALHKKYRTTGYGSALSLFEDGRIYKNVIVDIRDSGVRDIYRVTLSNGVYIDCTLNHKFPTPSGERKLEDLCVGDPLYVRGSYEKNTDKYLLTKEGRSTNIPQKGEMGFQKVPNGNSVVFNGLINFCREHQLACDICGREYDHSRFELHHKDLDRTNNKLSNLQWLCNSCHKKTHYASGRRKMMEKGLPVDTYPIVSIEFLRRDQTYDVEMADPAHNFVLDNGIVTSNCHALSMAFDSLYEAWMKAHHTSKFYEVVLNHYQAKGDKDKIAMLIQEAKEFFGYTIGEYRFGQDHSHFVVDDDTKVIYPSLISIKGIGEQASSDLMQISEDCGDHILDVLLATRGTKINRTVITNLAQIGFFARFGSVKKIEDAIELFDRWIGTQVGRKTINIADLPGTGLSIEEVQRYATNVLPSGKISEKRYTITDLHGLVRAMIDALPDDEYPSTVLAKYEYGVLGDITKVDPSVDRHICVAMGLDTKFSPRFVGYCLANGKRQEMRVHKRKDGRNRLIKESFDSVPFEDGDLIYLKNCERKARQRKVNDKWVTVPGVFDWWVNDYSVIK